MHRFSSLERFIMGMLNKDYSIPIIPLVIYLTVFPNSLLTRNFAGSPYVHNKTDLCKPSKIWVDVMFFGPTLKAYSIIKAKCPPGWVSGEPVSILTILPSYITNLSNQVCVTKDIGSFGFATTIGCAEFRENIMNRTNLRLNDSTLSVGVGRRAVVSLQ